MTEQKERARGARKAADGESWKGGVNLFPDVKDVSFCGYETDECETEIVAMAAAGERVTSAGEGDSVIAVLASTPFYAESGGQIGDTGVIEGEGFRLLVTDTHKDQNGIHTMYCTVEAGDVSVKKQGKGENRPRKAHGYTP